MKVYILVMSVEYESDNIIKVCSSKEDADNRIKSINDTINKLHSCHSHQNKLYFSDENVRKDPLYKELVLEYKIEEIIQHEISYCLNFKVEEWDVV